MIKKVLLVLLAVFVLFSLAACKNTPDEPTQSFIPEVTGSEIADRHMTPDRDPLTGISGYDETLSGRKFIGVVVENSPDARPQWGMSTPDIIMEYEVEGGITRMLWLYANENSVPARVGPIRSARHDPVELAVGHDMLLIHCGGSSFALDLIEKTPELAEIDGMSYYACFERDQTRNVASEHRYCLLGDKLSAAITELGIDMTLSPDKSAPFLFTGENAPRTLTGGDCSDIKFSYSSNYLFDFAYNTSSGLYACSLNGKPRTDDTGTQCAYTNVIVLYTEMADLHTSSGHQDLLLEKGGKGLYVSGGHFEEITWEKPTLNDPLKLIAADGSELVLNCGNSYIGFVRSTQQTKTSVF